MRGTGRSVQQRLGEVTVSSLGLFQYRLPFADLLEDITVEFARRVLQILLMGNSVETPRSDPTLAKEPFISGSQSPAALVREFLRQQLGASRLGQEWRVLFNGVLARDAVTVQKALRALSVNPARDDAAWRDWLLQFVLLLLNGQQSHANDQIDPVLRRGAKLGLVQAVLDTLLAEREPMSLQGIASQIEQLVPDPEHPAVKRLYAFAEITRELREQIDVLGDALGLGAKPTSLYTSLTRRKDRINQHWERQREWQTRSYITETADGQRLSKVWYDAYMLKPDEKDGLSAIEKGVRQLYWEIQDHRPILVMSLPLADGEERVEFDPDDVVGFEQKLLYLGRYFARHIPEKEGLAKILNANHLGVEQVEETATLLMAQSGIMLGTNESALEYQPGIVLSAHQGITGVSDLIEQLKQKLPPSARANMMRLETTDPFSLTLVSTADAIRITGVTSLEESRKIYMDEMGLNGPVRLSVPTAVFEAEATALDYERQLVKIKGVPRLFHPVVVTGLANRIKAETYLLGVVLSEVHDSPSDWIFDAPELGEDWLLLTGEELNKKINGRLMEGLLCFIGSRTQTAWQPRISEATAAAIRARYLRDDALLEVMDEWEAKGGADWRQRYVEPEKFNEQIVEDLIAIARLLIVNILS
jgi:hypothetical protein